MTSHVLASPRIDRLSWGDTLLVMAAWVFVAALALMQQLPALTANGPPDPDSQMRLVEVRDYLAGAPWTDLRQMRLAPPDGVLMHWSRLIDLPIATLIRLARPAFGAEHAEVFAIAVWPLLLYLVYFFGIAAIARRLIGPGAVFPAIAFAIFASPATSMFMPGHITHHNAQIALFTVLLAFVLRIDRGEIYGVLAGLTAALMLSIGLETLPLIGMIGIGLALIWCFAPQRTAAGLSAFGLFFGTGMVVQRAFAAAPKDWLATSCDIASFPYVAVAVIGGFGLAGFIRLAPTALGLRFAGLGVLGAAVIAAIAAINPHCLHGPYAEMDPRIVTSWLENVEEARSFGQVADASPAQLVGLYLAPFLALIPTSWAFAHAGRNERAGWSLVLLLLMTALAVSMWEARGATFASVLVVPGMAYTVIGVRAWCLRRGPVVLALGLLLIYTLPNQVAQTIAAELVRQRFAVHAHPGTPTMSLTAANPFATCAARANYAVLAVQPVGTVLIESNMGPSVLLNTPHATIAAPYHRNGAGITDGFAAFEGGLNEAYQVIARRKIGYVAICPDDPETDLISDRAPAGLMAHLLKGDAPDWLKPILTEGNVKLWRVVDPTVAGEIDMSMTGAAVPRRSLGPTAPAIPLLRGAL